MGKIDKETRLRVDGMRRALEIVEEKGVEPLRAEVRMRGSLGIPCAITREKAVESFRLLASRLYATYVSTSAMAVHDVFGAGEDRLKRWKARLDWYVQQVSTIDDYGEKWMDFKDMAQELNDRYNLGLDLDAAATVDDINNDRFERRASVPALYDLLKREGFEDAAEFLRDYLKEAFEDEKRAV